MYKYLKQARVLLPANAIAVGFFIFFFSILGECANMCLRPFHLAVAAPNPILFAK